MPVFGMDEHIAVERGVDGVEDKWQLFPFDDDQRGGFFVPNLSDSATTIAT